MATLRLRAPPAPNAVQLYQDFALSLAAGSFSLGAQDIPTFNVGAPLAQGAFALTGNASTWDVGLAPGQGSFALTGEPLSLTFQMVFPLGQGAFTFTAEPLTGYALTLAFSQGAFAFTGNATSFGSAMSAAQGAFAFTGNDTSYLLSLTQAIHGLFNFTGSPATLTSSGGAPVLDAATGFFGFTGNAATLGAKLPAAGTLAITPSAGLAITSPMTKGPFAINGQTTPMGPGIVPAVPTYGLTFAPAVLSYSLTFPLSCGVFNASGAATLAAKMPTAPGAFSWSAPVTHDALVMQAGDGALALTGELLADPISWVVESGYRHAVELTGAAMFDVDLDPTAGYVHDVELASGYLQDLS